MDSGAVSFTEVPGKTKSTLEIPCGSCTGCLLERSRQWAVRCMHEAQLYEQNAFITCTYSEEKVPENYGLDYGHYQKFMRRLRKSVPQKVRFYMCGEYGELLSRPHYHACLFNINFSDRKYFRTSDSGSAVYTSKTLDDLWTHGNCYIGDVTFESAAYIARYVMKKVFGKNSQEHYRICDPDTGEIYDRKPEFTKMSLKPGIGARWLEKYLTDVFPHDRVVVNGHKTRPPKYYFALYKDMDPMAHADIQCARELDALEKASENTTERLAVREVVKRAAISKLKRKQE